MFKNKTLLITGGTGSFGNAVLKRFLNTEISEIRIFSRDEKKQDDMRHHLQNDKVKFYIGDVRDFNSINSAMRGVDYVFSAAALKQVPSCEFYPLQAVYTNVLGTENTLNAAIENNVKNVIVLSTDKAVYPINAMGMSKALMEKVAVAKARTIENGGPVICVTRYGNVMASRGSVIPLFTGQLKAGKALTVTDPDMTRFMMSLDDAVDLVLFAFKNGKGGDTFLKTIFKLNNEVRVIGTRHGEKKHETLLNREELVHAEDLKDYFRVPSDTRDLNYGKYFEVGESKLSLEHDYTSGNTKRLNDDELKKMLLKLDYIKRELSADRHQPADDGF
jgi:UDP-glucose 4-epimerase